MNLNFNLYDAIREQFYNSLLAMNIIPKSDRLNGTVSDFLDRLNMNGRLTRFSTQDDNHGEKSGAYYIYSDGWPNWGIMDYRQHDHMTKFKLDIKDLNDDAKNSLIHGLDTFPHSSRSDDADRRRRERQNQELISREQSKNKAYDEWQRASFDGALNHPYVKLKHLTDLGGRVKVVTNPAMDDICHAGDLLIPLIDIRFNKFQSLQRISAHLVHGRHIKGIYPNTSLKSACYVFHSPHTLKYIICEGFATGSSIFSFVKDRATVIAAMSCHNMQSIAEIIRPRTQLPIVIAADNDDAGLKAASKIFKLSLANSVYVPPVEGQDWNDYIISHGM